MEKGSRGIVVINIEKVARNRKREEKVRIPQEERWTEEKTRRSQKNERRGVLAEWETEAECVYVGLLLEQQGGLSSDPHPSLTSVCLSLLPPGQGEGPNV